MILNKYSWAVTILYKCYHHDLPQIKDHLSSIGCSAVPILLDTDILTESKFNISIYILIMKKNLLLLQVIHI